ncbi:Na/Pi cotransporter family protein [Dehalobacter sp. DCM]|uniref:Na/Pi cotransporter family protein n=1 Tax=Dehalobacter sp. DCM TaxID=2907827 RepID=UPI0030820FA2|nr:Na/Pi cotransporter family protein [Dehalobacter sp. DCM]
MSYITMAMHFLGGLGLFLYGVNVTSDGLQKIAANRLKSILASLTKKPWAASLFGIVMTVALQSSTATTVMIVEFVNSGFMSLTQALGVVLGSAVGTSIVIQLISFPILNFSLFLLFIGFILLLIVRTPLTKSIGQAFIGFGCIFVGMSFLSGAFAGLKTSPLVGDFLTQLGVIPLLGIIVSILITTLLQSSAAFLAILISLSTNGLLTIEAIIPLVMGAHIGGTMTTLFSSLSSERTDAVRVAVANSIYRIAAAIILLPFFKYVALFVQWTTADFPRQVANTHLFSAIFMVVLFLPLNKYLTRALLKWVPQRKREERQQLIYLSRSALELPEVALNQVRQEIRWLGNRILENMFQLLPRLIFTGDTKVIAELERTEREVDWHYEELSKFIKDLYRRDLTREQIVASHSYQLIIKELEYLADSLVVMARLGGRIHSEKMTIHDDDIDRMGELYILVSENFLTLLPLLNRGEKDLAEKIFANQERIIESYNLIQNGVVCGMQKGAGNSVSVDADEVQKAILDLDNWFYKINEHIVRIAKTLQNG